MAVQNLIVHTTATRQSDAGEIEYQYVNLSVPDGIHPDKLIAHLEAISNMSYLDQPARDMREKFLTANHYRNMFWSAKIEEKNAESNTST